jgi:diadenosine tetraphosphatase ApaH/serine/threonine PP2A family protein phosphatase
VLRDARHRGVEKFIDLGDILSGPLWPRETYHIFRDLPLLAGIRGNQDRRVDGLDPPQIAWPSNLPATATTVGGEVFLCHGTPASDTTYLLEDVTSGLPVVRTEREIVNLLAGVTAPVVLCGHSHIPRVVLLSSGQMIVNPGSVGLPAYDDDKPVRHFMETYSPHASYAVLEKGAAGWGVSLHRVVYDWSEAARQARSLGREDWAQGLEAGRMLVAGTTVHSVT